MAVAEKEIISASQDERSILDHAQDVLLSSKDRIPKLVGPDGDEIPLPPSLFLVLRQSIYHLMRGRAISIVPVNLEKLEIHAPNFAREVRKDLGIEMPLPYAN